MLQTEIMQEYNRLIAQFFHNKRINMNQYSKRQRE